MAHKLVHKDTNEVFSFKNGYGVWYCELNEGKVSYETSSISGNCVDNEGCTTVYDFEEYLSVEHGYDLVFDLTEQEREEQNNWVLSNYLSENGIVIHEIDRGYEFIKSPHSSEFVYIQQGNNSDWKGVKTEEMTIPDATGEYPLNFVKVYTQKNVDTNTPLTAEEIYGLINNGGGNII